MKKTRLMFLLLLGISPLFSQAQAQTSDVNVSADYFEKALMAFNDDDFEAAYIHLKNILNEYPDHVPGKILMGKILFIKGYFVDSESVLKEAHVLGGDSEFIVVPLAEALLMQDKSTEVVNYQVSEQLSKKTRVNLLILHARAYAKLHKVEQELLSLEKALALAKTATTLNGLAAYHIKDKNIEKAHQLLNQALELDPVSYKTWYLRGQSYKITNDQDKALAAFEQALKLKPSYVDALRSIASLYINQGENDLAFDYIEKVLSKSPSDPRAKLLKANLLIEKNNEELARATLNQLNQHISVIPDDVKLKYHWIIFIDAVSAYLLGNYETAIRKMKQYLTFNPDNIQAISFITNAYLKVGSSILARDLLDANKSLISQNLNLSIILCDLYLEGNYLLRCASLIESLPTSFKTDPKLILLNARLLFSRSEVKKAVDLLESAQKDIDDFTIDSYLVQLYLVTEKHIKAGLLIEKLLKDFPDNVELKGAMAAALLKMNKPHQAAAILHNILQNNPENITAQYNMASAFLINKEVQQAKGMLTKLIKQTPDNVPALLLLVEVQMLEGKSTEAAVTLKIVLKHQPHNKQANSQLSYLYALTGQYEQALSLLLSRKLWDRLNPEVIESLAKVYIEKKAFEQANSQLLLLTELVNDSAERMIDVSHLQRKAENLSGARTTINKALLKAPNSLKVKFADAKLSYYENELTVAKNKVAALKKRLKNNSQLLVLEADIAVKDKKFTKAQQLYLSAFALTQTDSIALVKAHHLALRGVNTEGFETSIVQALKVQNNNYYYRNLLADFYLLYSRFDEARIQYLLIKDIKDLPNKADVLNNLAFATMYQDIDEAFGYAKQAKLLKPKSAQILDTYGWILAHKKEYDQALSSLRQARSFNGRDPSVRYHLGYVLFKLDRAKEAINELEYAIETETNFLEKKQAVLLYNTIKNSILTGS
ncbi:MAG: PEP-CTERM system TPR-repeat protein PrsT [Colwellia sp.]|nr:PEP-CTERM system TPR-repeat protein PrsT [Colwellia sp.]